MTFIAVLTSRPEGLVLCMMCYDDYLLISIYTATAMSAGEIGIVEYRLLITVITDQRHINIKHVGVTANPNPQLQVFSFFFICNINIKGFHGPEISLSARSQLSQ